MHAREREMFSIILPVSRVANKLFCKQNKTTKQNKKIPPLNTLHEAMHGIHTPKDHFTVHTQDKITHATACQLSLQKLVSY